MFREYQRIGFMTAIDDFGAGYAGLNLLADFQPEIIKLDMELVRHIATRKASQAIVRGVAGICRELGCHCSSPNREGMKKAAKPFSLAALRPI
ncbi:EAL domain-containing protein [Chromobacterium amazonense]|uniref:EAL domain-containing protein n=1 Tax=Chromobacterium amazonense TaxID=1382803 RepID=A0ABU8V439_9NEIS|nr:EAL domain-containing protein [Chromobacterium amazonense]MDQ4540646.1 EAL domain-containing protein [Chromobacterium amazonense]